MKRLNNIPTRDVIAAQSCLRSNSEGSISWRLTRKVVAAASGTSALAKRVTWCNLQTAGCSTRCETRARVEAMRQLLDLLRPVSTPAGRRWKTITCAGQKRFPRKIEHVAAYEHAAHTKLQQGRKRTTVRSANTSSRDSTPTNVKSQRMRDVAGTELDNLPDWPESVGR